jgi:hypothetical protein
LHRVAFTHHMHKFSEQKFIYLLCLLSFFAALSYNSLNLKYIPEEYTRERKTIVTSDDDSYLSPALNFFKNKNWSEDYYGGKVGYFIRPPGYGILYFLLTEISSPSAALNLLKYFQLILFSVSVYWFYKISHQVVINKKIIFGLTAIYGLSPLFTNFLFYTLTEGITPALVLGFVYFILKSRDENKTVNSYSILAAILFSFLFITRPVLGLFALLFTLIRYKNIAKEQLKSHVKNILWIILIAFLPMILWQIRNYKIAGKYVGLHPIYFEDNNTIYRTPFKAYWEFAGGWAERADKGFSYMIPIWESTIRGDTSEIYTLDAINNMPIWVVNHFGKERLMDVLKTYQASILVQKKYLDKGIAMPMVSSNEEILATQKFEALTSEFKHHFWYHYYILSPLKVFKLMAFHSNLSMYMFQKTFRGFLFMEVIRILFFCLHSVCFLFLLINLFLGIRNKFFYLACVMIPFIYVFYLCLFQRGIEERYTLPILPLLLIGAGYTTTIFFPFFTTKKPIQ